ncbi:membrane dipeptidase [Thalassotalea sp. M1531]|uniref:Membrane dipeptidase n=1 Tax=Thalassotalea algicola TaxID=2716224 RepID=A0A7Y0Q911_9GAMM|nr:dipeptidase [Thalassotalea algicola]NMP32705.1 membrane dipeptidase [Thalassotalea algicola]
MKFLLKSSLLAIAVSSALSTAYAGVKIEQSTIDKAKAIHERVIVLDTHHDFSVANFSEEKNYTMRLKSQVNLPKMDEGGLDVSWLIVYTGQGALNAQGYATAHKQAMAKFDAIHRLTTEIAPDKIELALTSDDVRRIVESGKKVAMIGVENGYPIGTDISNVKKFYDLGARYMSLAHNGHSQLSDSNTGDKDKKWLHNGLSDLGREAVKEMNKWGIMIDISHPSKAANLEMMALSKAPVIASHSASRAMYDHSRNLDDEELLALKENGGVVQAVAFRSYIDGEKSKAFADAKMTIYKKIAKEKGYKVLSRDERKKLTPTQAEAYWAKFMEVAALAEPEVKRIGDTIEQVSVSDLVDHIDYMVKLIGIEHVGISSDFDGGGGVKGWNDASETFNVTLELVKRGYTETDIEKMWSGNLLRVLDEVQNIAQSIQQKS